MRIVDTQLGTDRKTFDGGDFGEHRRDHLVFFRCVGIVLAPFERVFAKPLPRSVVNRRQTSVRPVGIPVRKHESGRGNGRIDGVLSGHRFRELLIGQHRFGSQFEPLVGLGFQVCTDIVAVEIRIRSRSVLRIETARNIIVDTVRGAADLQFVALQRGEIVENLIEPVDVDL